jgi:DNA polymerase I
MTTAARLLSERPLLAWVPFGGNDDLRTPPAAVVVSDGIDAAVASIGELTTLRWWDNHDRIAVFGCARPSLRRLLAAGIDVARPVCLHTLGLLSGDGAEPSLRLPREEDAARAEAMRIHHALPTLLASVDQAGHRRVARLESLVLRAFSAMEHRGLAVDVAAWRQLVDQARQRLATHQARFMELAGHHVGRDLFGMPDLRLEADGEVRSLLSKLTGVELDDVSKFTLRGLDHPAAQAMLQWREAHKIVSTYGEALLERVDVRTKRLHATFIPLGAATGRVACRDPNLQNLPSGDAFGACLHPPSGRAIITADYGACELRIVAAFSGDPVFRAAFERHEDVHATVATALFGVPVSKHERPELRHRAKGINFGLVYGMGPAGLATSLGIERSAAEELLAAYFQRFPRIRAYLEDSVEQALSRGYSETVLGRRLRYDLHDKRIDHARGEYARIMKNMPIQGTSADMTKLAMVRVHERLQEMSKGSAGLVNCVHDELVVECDNADADRVAVALQEEMAAAHTTLIPSIPPAVDVHITRSSS